MLFAPNFRSRAFACLLFMGCLLPFAAAPASARESNGMPPGAFLRSPVSGVSALDQQLRTDSLVVSRYSRLLRLTPAMVRSTFAQLHLTHLRKDTVLEVYYVHAGETIGYKARRVRQGTPIFALADGTPVLAQVCGNPLRSVGKARQQIVVSGVPQGQAALGAHLAEARAVPDFDPQEPLRGAAPAAPTSSLALRNVPPPLEAFPETRDTLASDEVPANVLEPGEILPTQTPSEAHRSLVAWLSGGALLGTIGAIGASTIIPPLVSPTPPLREPLTVPPAEGGRRNPVIAAATPEPGATALFLGLSVSSGMLLWKKRRRNRAIPITPTNPS